MIKAVIFDLDGTLLPMNENEFVKFYFGLLCKKVVPLGYDKDLFIKTVTTGTYLMRKNDGKISNAEVFWNYFASVFGEEKLKDKAVFDEFYMSDFEKTKDSCGFNPIAKDIVEYCKSKVGSVIMASNPIFPKEAMEWRMKFAGLNPDDFDYISDYENSSCCKPNPEFLKDILKKQSLNVDEVVYFGNNEVEDGWPTNELGIKVFMVGDDIIKDEEKRWEYKHIPLEEIKKVL